MLRHKVEITRIAEADIQYIFDYISTDSKTAAIRLVDEIERQIETLETSPMRCAVIPESHELGGKYRHLIYGNYRTIFRIDGARVIIMRVIHGARLLDMQILESQS
ncbi:MAG: type II toxin-antitoxin system RelE/ParE family toxin [Nitrospirae bacterium]|nr:MAG: type II toxin-antitoxin system RelE/ParE family toxin [Nitrospirota bacterium]